MDVYCRIGAILLVSLNRVETLRGEKEHWSVQRIVGTFWKS